RTKAVVIVNPNNPTGSFLKPAERRALAELASKYSLPVICDEVFLDYPLAEAAPGGTLLGCGAPLTFCLNGLSKMAGMPHLKLGWIVLDGDRAKVRAARDRLELILDTYLSVNLPVQSALSDLFAVGDEIRAKLLARIRGNFAFLKAELTASAVHVLTTEGGWSAILQLPKVLTEEVWVERLLTEQDIIVQPGYFFDMFSEPYVVVSLIAEPEAFRIGVRRLKTLSSAG
ncbi:MAG: pyridoxal phosphate-dependent aminotransferase, partial [Acidobacteriaceae bacterium]|nr:pyridoxal phosphate-dependent aminotransferase [Acidobacteriaceae bacterium]